MKRSYLYFLPAIAWTFIIILLTLLPGNDVPNLSSFFARIPYFDKWVHGSLFLGFVVLWGWGIYKSRKTQHLLFLLLGLAVIGSLFGIVIEYLQRTSVIGRDFDVWDMAADMAGAFIAVIFLYVIYRLRNSKPASPGKS